MPHIVVEYTANIRDDARIPALLRTINATLIAQGGVFPTAASARARSSCRTIAWPTARRTTRSST